MRSLLSSIVAAVILTAAGIGSAFAQGQIIIINNNAAGVGFNDATPAAAVGGNPGLTLGQQRLNVFNLAADIWEATLQPKVDIYVQAQFVPLAPNVLGSAGTTFVFTDSPGAEFPGMWYHSALADHLAGEDLNPGFADINTNFSTNFVFYLGFDNNEGTLVDLLPVVLHELGHGLGFANFANEANGTLFLDTPDIYSQYTLDVTTGKIWNAMTNAERIASAINVRKVSWSGINVKKDVPEVLEPGEPFVRINNPAALGPLMLGTASFGTALTGTGVSGDVVLGDDGVAPGADGCTPLPAGSGTGKIMLLDRGICGFVIKVKNAQDAGAIAVIIADNAAGSPPAGLGGVDPTITIPSGRVTLADGNLLKAQLAAGLNATLGLDLSILAGTDRVQKLMMVASLNPVALGSSISHFESVAFPNQLMEPAINSDLTASVATPEDLTTSLFTDIGWFSDQDGVPDGVDSCIGSDIRPEVFVESCNTGTANTVFLDGCSISDELLECASHANRPGLYLACVAAKTNAWKKSKVITPRNQAAIIACAAK